MDEQKIPLKPKDLRRKNDEQMLALKLKDLRKKNDRMSQQALAKKLRISQQSVAAWESGKTMPDVSCLKELSGIFGVTIDYLLDNDIPIPVEEPKKENEMDARSRRQLDKFLSEMEGSFEGGPSEMTDEEREAVRDMMIAAFKLVKQANKRKK